MLFGLIDREGKIIIKKEKDFYEADKSHIEEVIEETITSYIKEILEEENLNISQIEKIGIAAPGTHKENVIIKAENLGITNFKIVDRIKKYFKEIDITLNNDAKCAAMCEKTYGSLKNYEDSIFICLGTGIGGAVFLGGKLLKAKRYTGFELRTCGT